MELSSLGRSNLLISPVSLGCMSLPVDQHNCDQIIHSAIDHGVNFIDTADLYEQGQNEIRVGNALAGRRDRVILASKVGNRWRKDGSGWDWVPSKHYIIGAIDDSLQRLKTDYLDLYQLHGGTLEDPIDEIIEAFERLKESGKIRAYGISSIRPNVIREYVSRSQIDSVMMQYSLLDRRPEESCLGLLQSSGIGVLARGVTAKGMLIDKPAKPYLGHTEATIENLQSALQASGHGLDYSLGFTLNHPAVTSAVVGIRTLEQLQALVLAKPTYPTEEICDLAMPRYYELHR